MPHPRSRSTPLRLDAIGLVNLARERGGGGAVLHNLQAYSAPGRQACCLWLRGQGHGRGASYGTNPGSSPLPPPPAWACCDRWKKSLWPPPPPPSPPTPTLSLAPSPHTQALSPQLIPGVKGVIEGAGREPSKHGEPYVRVTGIGLPLPATRAGPAAASSEGGLASVLVIPHCCLSHIADCRLSCVSLPPPLCASLLPPTW